MAKLNELIVTGPSRFASKVFINDTLTAPTVIGNLTGQAEKALKDSLGNQIDTTYSTKTNTTSEINTAVTQLKNEILGGASGAYDTLKEIEDILKKNQNSIDSLLSGTASKIHYHGTDNDNGDFIKSMENTTTDNGWSMINSKYGNNFILKSIRTNSSAPAWILGNFSAGIAFGGSDTYGVMSISYTSSSPQVRFAGGNGSKPQWYFTLTGTGAKAYNLNNMPKATIATQLETARTIQVNLASTSTASFNGTANITPGVTGTLAVANGGTGQTTLNAGAQAFIKSLSAVSAQPVSAQYYVCQNTDGNYCLRKTSFLYDYIKSTLSTDAASHVTSALYLTGWSDTRSVTTQPNDYNNSFRIVGIKNNATIPIDGSSYSTLMGLRGWLENSGGAAHELAFTGSGNLYHRYGATTSWNAWNRIPMCGTANTFSNTNTFNAKVTIGSAGLAVNGTATMTTASVGSGGLTVTGATTLGTANITSAIVGSGGLLVNGDITLSSKAKFVYNSSNDSVDLVWL